MMAPLSLKLEPPANPARFERSFDGERHESHTKAEKNHEPFVLCQPDGDCSECRDRRVKRPIHYRDRIPERVEM